MGNIHSGVSNHVERFPLGDSAEMVLRKTKNCRGRQVVDTWTAEYSVGRTSCELGLTKINRNKRDEELSISLHDRTPGPADDDVDLQLDVRAEKDLLVANFTLNGPSCLEQLPERKIPIAEGGVIKSSSFLYGRDRKGLLVILRAKRNDEDKELPYMITIKHYFVAPCSSHTDVGLSAVAKILNNNGQGLSLQLDNPVAQPKHYLLSMLNDVKRTGWRPNPSSDCSIEHSLSKQNKGNVPVLCVGDKNNPAAKPNADSFSSSISGEQTITSLISTSGYTNGNYNGSLIFENCHVRFDHARRNQ